MNYEKIYNQLIEKCKVRGLDKSKYEGYYEIHHIVPRCLGGSNEKDNLVMFTGREHFIAHMLLWKVYPNVQGLAYAAFMMSTHGGSKNSVSYEKLRSVVAEYNCVKNTGRLKVDYTGHKIGRLSVLEYVLGFEFNGKRLPKWKCLCDCGNACYVATPYLRRERILSCGCLALEVRRDKLLGKEKSQEIREKISNTLKLKNIKPWELPSLNTSDKDKWLKANHLYRFWLSNGKPKAQNMTNLFNGEFSSSYKRSYFKTIVKHFLDGWIPEDDISWLEFSKGINNG